MGQFPSSNSPGKQPIKERPIKRFLKVERQSGRKIGRNLLGIFVLFYLLCRMTHQIFSQTSSEFITPCHVAEVSEIHLHELLGLGGPTHCVFLWGWEAVGFCHRGEFWVPGKLKKRTHALLCQDCTRHMICTYPNPWCRFKPRSLRHPL